MKSNLVRLFVLSLTVAGFGAVTVSAHARTGSKAEVAPVSVSGSQALCVPSGAGGYCGMD